ncbi:MAG: hypothetical protein Q9184_001210 [Pyrenodesmia sp. 2 TL-2023]
MENPRKRPHEDDNSNTSPCPQKSAPTQNQRDPFRRQWWRFDPLGAFKESGKLLRKMLEIIRHLEERTGTHQVLEIIRHLEERTGTHQGDANDSRRGLVKQHQDIDGLETMNAEQNASFPLLRKALRELCLDLRWYKDHAKRLMEKITKDQQHIDQLHSDNLKLEREVRILTKRDRLRP